MVTSRQRLEFRPVDLIDKLVSRRDGGTLAAVIGRLWKDRRQIAKNGPPPGADVGPLVLLPRFASQQLLQKLQHRRMIEHLRADRPAAAPWRSDNQRHAIAKPDRALPRRAPQQP